MVKIDARYVLACFQFFLFENKNDTLFKNQTQGGYLVEPSRRMPLR